MTYDFDKVQANILALCRQGLPRTLAVKESFKSARLAFFKRHPKGALPEWLAYPHNYRLREHYGAMGESLHGVRGNVVRQNPSRTKSEHTAWSFDELREMGRKANDRSDPTSDINRATKLYRAFTGHDSASVKRIKLKPLPKAGLVFGQLIKVGYRSARDGELYEHTFRNTRSRPLLIATSDGKQVLIVGGRYAFTERGIEDR